jgi:hypothetical protein
MNAQAGRREVHRACEQDCYSLDQIMISPLVSKVNLFRPVVVGQSDFHRVGQGAYPESTGGSEASCLSHSYSRSLSFQVR